MDTVATSQQLERICKHYFYANLFTIDSRRDTDLLTSVVL